jgi:hypothetical protein
VEETNVCDNARSEKGVTARQMSLLQNALKKWLVLKLEKNMWKSDYAQG